LIAANQCHFELHRRRDTLSARKRVYEPFATP
jgi:hypothetical protein